MSQKVCNRCDISAASTSVDYCVWVDVYLYALQPPVSKTNDPPVSNQTAYIRNQTRGKLKRVPKVRKEVLGFIIAQNEKSNLDPDILAFHFQGCLSSSVQNPSLWGKSCTGVGGGGVRGYV